MEEANVGRKIEIFAPFEAAFNLTKLILFQPFDLGKWCVIGFAAFLAHLAGGSGRLNFNYNDGSWKNSKWNWQFNSTTSDAFGGMHVWAGWIWALIIFLCLLIFAIVVVCLWVGCRGKFIFTDCIVRNRGAIVAPWSEFKREGNSLFLFMLLAAFILLIALVLAAIPIWMAFFVHRHTPRGAALVIGIGLVLVIILLSIAYNVVASFMVPVMYRRRCRAMEAFSASLSAIAAHFGPVVLYVLFIIVLYVAFAIMACVLTCVTCCLAAIPYVGTVILLPFYVFFASYLLFFVRQFGPDYDAWGNILTPEPAIPETLPPPPIPPESEPPPPAPEEPPPIPGPPPIQL